MDNDVVTKKDLEAFGKEFEAKLDAKLEAKLEAKLTEKLGTLKDELAEAIRDAQSEILRGFHAFQTGWDLPVTQARSRPLQPRHVDRWAFEQPGAARLRHRTKVDGWRSSITNALQRT